MHTKGKLLFLTGYKIMIRAASTMTLGTIDPYKSLKYTLDDHVMAQSFAYHPSVKAEIATFSASTSIFVTLASS